LAGRDAGEGAAAVIVHDGTFRGGDVRVMGPGKPEKLPVPR
jgi:hypothetical protein